MPAHTPPLRCLLFCSRPFRQLAASWPLPAPNLPHSHRPATGGRSDVRIAVSPACCRLTAAFSACCRHTGLPEEVSHTKQALALGYAFVAINSLNRDKPGAGDDQAMCFS